MRLRIGLLLPALLLRCGGSPAPTPTVVVQTDLAGIQKLISLPEGLVTARYALVKAGNANPRVPGPDDFHLYAFVRILGLEGAGVPMVLGQPVAEKSIDVPEDVARALLPEDVVKSMSVRDGSAHLEGDRYDPAHFEQTPYHGSFAIALGGGFFLGFSTT